MDSSEKVIVFDTFEALTHEISNDIDNRDIRACRYAVRFIMLNNFNEFRRLAAFLDERGVCSLDLETLMCNSEDDEWITKDTLKEAIKQCETSTIVTPFSELVRFYNDDDFRGFFNEIMLLEDIHHPQKRIYMPLIGLQNRFADFLNHFARIKESAPVWRYNAEPQTVEVFLSKYKDANLPNDATQCQLSSLREWLRFWKAQAPQERIVCTSKPIVAKHKYSKPDNIFNFQKIESAYGFMTQFMDLKFPFDYDEEEKEYWEELLNHINRERAASFLFEAFVHKHFNRVKFDAADIIAEWSNGRHTSFDRWLLKKYVTETGYAETYPYLALCMEDTPSLGDGYQLTKMIATRIVYGLPSNKQQQYALERRGTIRKNQSFFEANLALSDQEWLCDQVKQMFQQNHDLDFAIDLCTGVFDFEKRLLMGWSLHYPQNKKLQEAISELYPDYAAYLSSAKPSVYGENQEWFINYIKAYKQAKLEDKYTQDIATVIQDKNASSETFYRWYFSFNSSHEALAESLNSSVYRPDRVYWIDGLGAEFLSYILYIVEQENSGMNVVLSQITRSELPSSTHHNRFVGDNVVKFGALDELGHDMHGYKRFDTLIEELAIVRNIIKEIINTCKNEKCTVAIVSDHGMTCLSRKAQSKKYDGKFEHEGRYIKTTDDALSDSNYIVYRNDDEGQPYKVALTHSSLSKVPTHQVHGGCTPEEVLVPFILLSNKNVANAVKYQIKEMICEVPLSDPAVSICVIPLAHSVTLTCNGETYNMECVGTQWKALLQGITEGVHKADVQIDGFSSKEIEIKVIGVGGTDINDMFDL